MYIDVFISHHTDSSKHIAEAVSNKLEYLGVPCWYSGRDITGGDYASSIMEALAGCKIFLLILNRPASESAHVLNEELEIATKRLSQKEDIIIPFHIDDEEIAPAARYYIQRHHWIKAMTPPMYQRIEALTEHIVKLLGKEGISSVGNKNQKAVDKYCLINSCAQPREIFYGRDDLLHQIHGIFSAGKRVVFLEGIGGIGKSELAKQYAIQYHDHYDTIIFLTYVSDILHLICDPTALVIDGLERKSDEDDISFFKRKIQILNTISSERTLLIIDNFDVNEDPYLQVLLQGNYRLIFTTRNVHFGYTTIKIGPIDNKDALTEIFIENYGCRLSDSEQIILDEIFQLIECHTYTLELIAKQMAASFLTIEEMAVLLRDGTLDQGLSETVSGRTNQRTAFEHIRALFNIGKLLDEEKKIFMYLSLMDVRGILVVRFKEWAGLKNFEAVNQLIAKGWIRKENGQRLSLHPMVREVIRHEMKPTVDNCYSFLYQMSLSCYKAWFRTYEENLIVVDNVLAVLKYFEQLRGKDYLLFSRYSGFLWQVGKFEDSIYYGQKVYESCVREFGINTMEVGFIAMDVGGAYYNSNQKKESIKWYKQGLESMLASGVEENEYIGRAYEKVARCYTWKYEQDFDKAEKLFQISLQIRLRLLDRLEQGEQFTMGLCHVLHEVEIAYDRLAQIYLEMGRMYQAMGNYDKGYEYALKHTALVETYRPSDISNIAYGYFDSGVCQYYMGMQLNKQGNEVGASVYFNKAEENLRKALELNLKMRGTLAVDTIGNQEYLADVYVVLKRYGEASNGYMAVLAMIESLLGQNHPRIELVKRKMEFNMS